MNRSLDSIARSTPSAFQTEGFQRRVFFVVQPVAWVHLDALLGVADDVDAI